MPRSKRRRKVCFLPSDNEFGPLRPNYNREIIEMNVEEYEAIRLMDYEGLSQSKCAESMDIARTTAQRIYYSAKQKLADAFVNGKIIKITGGDYRLCQEPRCLVGGRKRCCRMGGD